MSEAVRARRVSRRTVFDALLRRAWRSQTVVPRVRPPPARAAASATAELQELLLATEDVTDLLNQPATLAVTMLPGEPSCGMTLRRGRSVLTVASSDTRANQVDEIQYGHDQGHCLHGQLEARHLGGGGMELSPSSPLH